MSVKLARREQHADDTRRAILAAARQAFAREGYGATSLDAIVARARVTKGALYHYFPSKAAVLEAVYVEMEQELARAVEAAAAAATGGAWGQLVASIDAFFTASAEPAYVRIVLCDAPLVLGRVLGRELDQEIGLGLVGALLAALEAERGLVPVPRAMTARILLAAVSEIAIAMAQAADPAAVRAEGTAALFALLDGLRPRTSGGSAP